MSKGDSLLQNLIVDKGQSTPSTKHVSFPTLAPLRQDDKQTKGIGPKTGGGIPHAIMTFAATYSYMIAIICVLVFISVSS